jgi:hypothetical protein
LATHGKNAKIYLNEADITQFLKSVGLDTSNDVVEATTLGSDSKVYIDGLKDATLTADGAYDDDKDLIDKELDDMEGKENIISYYPATDTAGNTGFVMKTLKSASSKMNSITEDVNFSLSGQTTEGIIRVKSLIAKTLIETDGNSLSLDLITAGDGLIITYHVFDINAAGDIDIIIQDSDDDNIFATFKTITVNSAESGIVTEIASVERYVRLTINGLAAAEDILLQVSIKKI